MSATSSCAPDVRSLRKYANFHNQAKTPKIIEASLESLPGGENRNQMEIIAILKQIGTKKEVKTP